MSGPAALVRKDLSLSVGELLVHVWALRRMDAFRRPKLCDLTLATSRWRLFDKPGGALLFTGVDFGVTDRTLVVERARGEIRLNVPAYMSEPWRWSEAWYELWLSRPGYDDLVLSVGLVRRV